MTSLPCPDPSKCRDIGRRRSIFGIVRSAPHVVCVQATATRAADGDQIVRFGTDRSHHRVEGRSLTTGAWSQNAKPRRWRDAVSEFRAAMAAGNLKITNCLPQRQTECNRKLRFFGREPFARLKLQEPRGLKQ